MHASQPNLLQDQSATGPKPAMLPPVLPATQRVLDQLDEFQAVIEAKLQAYEQSTTRAARALAPEPPTLSARQLLPLIVLTAIVTSVATLVVAQLIK